MLDRRTVLALAHSTPSPQPLPADLSTVTCRDASGWWIECVCTTGPNCHGGATSYPLRLMMMRHRCDSARLLDVAARLRCKQCGAKPSGLSLVDDPQRMPSTYSGKPPGGGMTATVFDLLPLLAARERGASRALQVTATTYLCPITSDDLARNPALRDQLADTFGLHRPAG